MTDDIDEWKDWLSETLQHLLLEGAVGVVDADGRPATLVDVAEICARGGRLQITLLDPCERDALHGMRRALRDFRRGVLTRSELAFRLKLAWNRLESFDPDWLEALYDVIARLLRGAHLPDDEPGTLDDRFADGPDAEAADLDDPPPRAVSDAETFAALERLLLCPLAG